MTSEVSGEDVNMLTGSSHDRRATRAEGMPRSMNPEALVGKLAGRPCERPLPRALQIWGNTSDKEVGPMRLLDRYLVVFLTLYSFGS